MFVIHYICREKDIMKNIMKNIIKNIIKNIKKKLLYIIDSVKKIYDKKKENIMYHKECLKKM